MSLLELTNNILFAICNFLFAIFRSRVATHILLLPLSTLSHDSLSVLHTSHMRWKMSLLGDFSDFMQTLVSLDQLFRRCNLFLLITKQWFQRPASFAFPNTDVTVIAPRNDIRAIQGKVDSEDTLHSFCMVHFSTLPDSMRENTDGLIVTSGGKFLTGRTVIYRHDSCCMILVDGHGASLAKLSHIVGVAVMIVIRGNKIHGFDRIPRDIISTHTKYHSSNGEFRSHVIQSDRSIRTSRRENITFDRIVSDAMQRIHGHRQSL